MPSAYCGTAGAATVGGRSHVPAASGLVPRLAEMPVPQASATPSAPPASPAAGWIQI